MIVQDAIDISRGGIVFPEVWILSVETTVTPPDVIVPDVGQRGVVPSILYRPAYQRSVRVVRSDDQIGIAIHFDSRVCRCVAPDVDTRCHPFGSTINSRSTNCACDMCGMILEPPTCVSERYPVAEFLMGPRAQPLPASQTPTVNPAPVRLRPDDPPTASWSAFVESAASMFSFEST